jgi:hypothetical protein
VIGLPQNGVGMGDAGEDLNEIVKSFYREPDAPRAVRAFEVWLRSEQPSVVALHAFTRMAMISTEVRAGVEGLRMVRPRLVEAVLRGFGDPTFPRVGDGPPAPEEMDLLWVEFFTTGDLAPVLRIIGILDEPDVVRAKLSQWLRETGVGFFGKRKVARFVPVFARCMIPVRPKSMDIDGPLDLDLSVALAAKARKLKFAELPVPLSEAEALRIAAKSAAVWSLKANAAAHPSVARLCELEATKQGGAARLLLAPSR